MAETKIVEHSVMQVMTVPRWLQVPVNMQRLVWQEVLLNTCTKVASGITNVAGIIVSTQKFINDTQTYTLRYWIFHAEHVKLMYLRPTQHPNQLYDNVWVVVLT